MAEGCTGQVLEVGQGLVPCRGQAGRLGIHPSPTSQSGRAERLGAKPGPTLQSGQAGRLGMNSNPASQRSAGRTATRAALLALFVVQAILAPLALANGGTIQVASRPAGPYTVTVFTSPSPIRVGTVDVSVLVQHSGIEKLVQDARVTVTIEPVGRSGTRRTLEATHEQATNKLYYAANIDLPAEGWWWIGVDVAGAEGEGSVSFQVEAVGANLLEDPPVLILVMAVPLLLGVLWLWRSGDRAHPTEGEQG